MNEMDKCIKCSKIFLLSIILFDFFFVLPMISIESRNIIDSFHQAEEDCIDLEKEEIQIQDCLSKEHIIDWEIKYKLDEFLREQVQSLNDTECPYEKAFLFGLQINVMIIKNQLNLSFDFSGLLINSTGSPINSWLMDPVEKSVNLVCWKKLKQGEDSPIVFDHHQINLKAISRIIQANLIDIRGISKSLKNDEHISNYNFMENLKYLGRYGRDKTSRVVMYPLINSISENNMKEIGKILDGWIEKTPLFLRFVLIKNGIFLRAYSKSNTYEEIGEFRIEKFPNIYEEIPFFYNLYNQTRIVYSNISISNNQYPYRHIFNRYQILEQNDQYQFNRGIKGYMVKATPDEQDGFLNLRKDIDRIRKKIPLLFFDTDGVIHNKAGEIISFWLSHKQYKQGKRLCFLVRRINITNLRIYLEINDKYQIDFQILKECMKKEIVSRENRIIEINSGMSMIYHDQLRTIPEIIQKYNEQNQKMKQIINKLNGQIINKSNKCYLSQSSDYKYLNVIYNGIDRVIAEVQDFSLTSMFCKSTDNGANIIL